VGLTVSDGLVSDLKVTTTTISGIFQARAFTDAGNHTIKLGAGKPRWCAEIEPVGDSYNNAAVDLSSIVMRSQGTGSVAEIHVGGTKTVVGSDLDGNGIDEITACFSKTDLRALFSGIHGKQTVTVTLQGSLFSGGVFLAQMDILVNGSGGNLAATVSPNPLNPDATLTFWTSGPGRVRVMLFDVSGRLVRNLMDDAYAPGGYHDVRIDGTGGDGGRLPSGVYLYRVEAAEGSTGGRLTILK
jgi:hypothetical protein